MAQKAEAVENFFFFLAGLENVDKLKQQLIIDQYSHSYGLMSQKSFVGTKYYTLHNETWLKEQFLPRELFIYFKVYLMVITTKDDNLPPHSDTGTKTNLNVYLSTGGNKKTTFWRPIRQNITPIMYNIYDGAELRATSEFTATQGSVYLLNVSEIHSVSYKEQQQCMNNDRCVLQFQTILDYEYVKKCLRKFYEKEKLLI